MQEGGNVLKVHQFLAFTVDNPFWLIGSALPYMASGPPTSLIKPCGETMNERIRCSMVGIGIYLFNSAFLLLNRVKLDTVGSERSCENYFKSQFDYHTHTGRNRNTA